MEPQETIIETAAESLIEPVVTAAKPPTNDRETTKIDTKLVSAPVPTNSIKDPSPEVTIPQSTPQLTTDLWNQVTATWEEYFGEGKKSNVAIAFAVLVTIPALIAISALLDFLNKLPILPSVFELVGFGYSVWFVYRYLLLVNTRKELTDTIAAWKNKILG